MGAADVIPGVSGGTIALIVGIYEELIDTISRYDGQMLTLLWQRKWKALFQRMNLSFLMPLGLGILMAIFSLAKLMTYLLSYHESLTYAVFFGLILGSVFLMARDFQKNLTNLGLLIFGAVFTFGLVGLLPMETPKTLIAFFTSALIAICAMILPGISGSFILLLLGKYKQVMEVVKSPFAGDHIWFVLVFALGALIGIIGFSKLLKWLLRHYHNALFAFLIGMMLGSLRKLWPFTGIDFSIGSIAGRIFLMLIGLAAVYLIYRAENYRTAKCRSN
ncbi:DUF368 domain-containing protein [Clostridiales bacterium COT073_COT-073]|nr:DUF368 domain-containing protein [Clostridiales bacterium COT073_COT-073]